MGSKHIFTCGTISTTAAASAHMKESISYNAIQLLTLPVPHRVNGPLIEFDLDWKLIPVY